MGFEWPTTQSEAQKYHFGQKIGHYKTPGSLNRHPGPKYTNPNPTQARKKVVWTSPKKILFAVRERGKSKNLHKQQQQPEVKFHTH